MEVSPEWAAHLEFALKNEGLHLGLLRQLFAKVEPSPLVEKLKLTPKGKYLRQAWYLYEALTGTRLPLADLTSGNYIDLLDPALYYTGPRILVRRQRINQNLLGSIGFCAFVRKTKTLETYCQAKLDERCRQVIAEYPEAMFRRALNYLYRKETKSSFEIERETPDQKRAGRFVELLREASTGDFLKKVALVSLQNAIVDPRFANSGFRDENRDQVYVGVAAGPLPGNEIVHFATPKPGDIALLMEEWQAMARMLIDTDELHPVIAAAVVSFAFVFLHPFSDGNGRIHRFLIHHVLSKRKFAPQDVVFPVSAVMLNRAADYDASLESFSKPLMELIDYQLDDRGRMTVLNETADLYRAVDYTMIAETLFSFVEETIEKELPAEFSFLENYDKARQNMRSIVDLPDRIADLLVRLVLQNAGSLSKKKRALEEFEKLSDGEISELETAVRDAFSLAAPGRSDRSESDATSR